MLSKEFLRQLSYNMKKILSNLITSLIDTNKVEDSVWLRPLEMVSSGL